MNPDPKVGNTACCGEAIERFIVMQGGQSCLSCSKRLAYKNREIKADPFAGSPLIGDPSVTRCSLTADPFAVMICGFASGSLTGV